MGKIYCLISNDLLKANKIKIELINQLSEKRNIQFAENSEFGCYNVYVNSYIEVMDHDGYKIFVHENESTLEDLVQIDLTDMLENTIGEALFYHQMVRNVLYCMIEM